MSAGTVLGRITVIIMIVVGILMFTVIERCITCYILIKVIQVFYQN